MSRLLLILCGALAALAACAFLLISGGFSANQRPGEMETWLARRARSMAVPREARSRVNPLSDSPELRIEARAHWADHCAGCHANDGSGDTQMGRGTYPPAPDMRLAPTQQMSDGELFYVIQNGIRFSAMPAWSSGSPKDEEDSWKLVLFIRHLPALTAEEKHEMERMNPRSPDEIKEELEEEKFLKGEDPHEPQIPHHRH